jgi:hypothetical protein
LRELQATLRDGVAARVMDHRRDGHPVWRPLRKRYQWLHLDLDAQAPADTEPCAPMAPHDL